MVPDILEAIYSGYALGRYSKQPREYLALLHNPGVNLGIYQTKKRWSSEEWVGLDVCL